MPTDPLDRFDRLFRAAQMHAPGERAAFLDAACADDPALRRELESLLTADDEAEQDAFLEEPAAHWSLGDLEAAPNEHAEGQTVGPYTILRLLGQGGMGDVYLAVRQQPFKRYVALKIIRRGMDTREVLLRFEMERQILASLDHPNIARLLDGGMTDPGSGPGQAGLPYFAMEYVEGVPLTRYCDARRLDVEARLRLFQTVCSAVQYAHQNLIIHRDLKPSNILVTPDGTVKLLDFGIAKLLNPHLSPLAVPVTRTEVRRMTPEYASPEQVRGEALTTASDVYALGVILYELLTGHRPYRLTNRTTAGIAQVVCEQDPERPSTKVAQTESIPHRDGTTETITPEAVSAARAATVDRLRRRLRGDLDNIVLMALRKEPERRYSSPDQLGQDLERYRTGQPVLAHQDTRPYRLMKFIKRHRVETLAAAIIAVLLVGFSLFTVLQSQTVARERDQKEREAQKAEQVTAFLLSLFETADPVKAPADTVMVRAVLDAGAARIETELAEQPEVQAEMLTIISRAFQNLGRSDRATTLAETALALRRRALGDDHPATQEAVFRLAGLLEFNGDVQRAQPLFSEYYHGLRARLGDGHPDLWFALYHLYTATHMQGQSAEADSLFAAWRALEGTMPTLDDPDMATSLLFMANVLVVQRQHEEAEQLVKRALAMERRLFGDRDARVGDALNELALILNVQEKHIEAEAAAREAVALHRTLYPEGHRNLATSLGRLGESLQGQQRYADAEPLLRESLALTRTLLGDDHLNVGRGNLMLARLMHAQQRYADAEPLYRQALALYQNRFGKDYLITIEHRGFLAGLLRDKGDFAAAETILLENLEMVQAQRGTAHRYTQDALRELVLLYEAWGHEEDAGRYRALLTP